MQICHPIACHSYMITLYYQSILAVHLKKVCFLMADFNSDLGRVLSIVFVWGEQNSPTSPCFSTVWFCSCKVSRWRLWAKGPLTITFVHFPLLYTLIKLCTGIINSIWHSVRPHVTLSDRFFLRADSLRLVVIQAEETERIQSWIFLQVTSIPDVYYSGHCF